MKPTSSTPVRVDERVQGPTATRRTRPQLGYGLRQIPVTWLSVLLLWVAGAATGSLISGPASALSAFVDVGPDTLTSSQWASVPASMLFPGGISSYVLASLVLLICVGVAELALGSGRA